VYVDCVNTCTPVSCNFNIILTCSFTHVIYKNIFAEVYTIDQMAQTCKGEVLDLS